MIEKLKPYAAYRESGLIDRTSIPQHWTTLRAKHVFCEVDEKSSSGKETLLSVSHISGVRRRSDINATMFLAKSNVGHKRCEPNDLVVNTMWAWMGALGVSPYSGIVSPAYAVYRQRNTSSLLPKYADHLLRTPNYIAEYTSRSTGIHSSRLRMYPEAFFRAPLIIPPHDEQAAIVRFLGHANRRIDQFIRTKKKLVALLNEQKQEIVQRAVTRGLDPNVKLKESGVPWLGMVPAHWEVTRVKCEFSCLNHQRVPLNAPERGQMKRREYDYYGASGVIDRVDDYLFDDDLLLIAEDGANLVLRNLPLAIIARGKFWVNNHAHILKPRRGSLEYLSSYMETIDYRPWITGAAQPKLTKDRLMSIGICVAPTTEQKAIQAHLDVATAPLKVALSTAEREVGLAREYRARLISDVVTGQLDVRAAAASLPDLEPEVASAEPSDDEGTDIEDSEAA